MAPFVGTMKKLTALSAVVGLPKIVAASSSSGLVCVRAGGIPGIESPDGRACCPASCGQCGGVGCSMLGDASDCCVLTIIEDGEACSDTEEAPCFIDDGNDGCDCADEPDEEPEESSWTYEVLTWIPTLYIILVIVRGLNSLFLFLQAFISELAARREARRLARAQGVSPAGANAAAAAASATAAANAAAAAAAAAADTAAARTALLDRIENILSAFSGADDA